MNAHQRKPLSRRGQPVRKPAVKENLRSKLLLWLIIALASPVLLLFKIGMHLRGIYGLRR